MLTSLYYYNYYKPYMLKTAKADEVVSRRPKIAAKEHQAVDSYRVLMNKSLKSDIVTYAKDVSSSIVGTKSAAKNIIRDMEDFNKNSYKRGSKVATRWIAEDLGAFAKQYNQAVDFLSSQNHSQTLKNYASDLVDRVQASINELESLSLSMDQTGKLNFDKDSFTSSNENDINTVIGQTINIFSDIYEDSTQILSEPLTEHMRFKGLGYFYNYKLGTIESDTFKMIERGMLVDKVV